MSPRLLRTVLPVLLGLVLAPVATADAKTYDLPALAQGAVTKIDAKGSVPVLLPDHLALDYGGKLYAGATASKRAWSIGFDGAADCGGANACFLAGVTAEKGGTPAYKRTVRLRGGVVGFFKPLTCGGSCSPPEIQFVRGGVLYSISAKVPGKALRRLTRAADEALAAGPRGLRTGLEGGIRRRP